MRPWGVPGEEGRLTVAPVFSDMVGREKLIDIVGQPGKYRVQFLLGRPGYPITREREYKFIDELVGSSHIKMFKPEPHRGPDDAERIILSFPGKSYQIVGTSDKEGALAKFECELEAQNSYEAEAEAYNSLAPSLSAWSMNADVPIHIEKVQTTNLTTQVSTLRIVTPFLEMNFGGSPTAFQEDFCQYASIYREGLNNSSLNYRFLCFYKIIESLIARRSRQGAVKKVVGLDPRRPYEVIPETAEDINRLLKRLYPWLGTWDQTVVAQILPLEVRGKKVTAVRDKFLRPLRLGIAHALLQKGEITITLDKMEDIQAINKWLPLCRICARWMLLTDFPSECSLAMR
jgi:hypothetical protein